MSSENFAEAIYIYKEQNSDRIRENARKIASEKGDELNFKDFGIIDIIHPSGHKGLDLFLEKHEVKPEHRVFDIGCGVGGVSRYLAGTFGCNVHGLDYLDHYVDAAKEMTDLAKLGHKCEFYQGDITNYGIPDNHFDLALSIAVFLYIPGTDGFKTVFDSLKPGGLFYIEDYMLTKPKEHVSLEDLENVDYVKMEGIRDRGLLCKDLESVGFEVARFEEYGREWSEYAWDRSERLIKHSLDPALPDPDSEELHTYGRLFPKILRQLDHLSPEEIRRRWPITSAEQNPEELIYQKEQFMTVMRVVARKP